MSVLQIVHVCGNRSRHRAGAIPERWRLALRRGRMCVAVRMASTA